MKKILRLTWPNIVRQTKVYDFQGRILILGHEKEILKNEIEKRNNITIGIKIRLS
jgi:hypothetical protein